MKKITALIIDDERLAREEIREHLRHYTLIELLGEASDADEAEEKISNLRPDLIFLDIQMPERSGIALLESLTNVPEVIFTTAYDQYAVKAFELNALDYLVKPIRKERFEQAVAKLQARMTGSEKKSYQQTIFIKEGERLYFIRTEDIHLIESAGNYARLHTKDRKHYIKRSLNQLEKALDPTVFFRAGRSEIINLHCIREISNQPKGKLLVILQSGQSIEASGRQSALLRNRNTI